MWEPIDDAAAIPKLISKGWRREEANDVLALLKTYGIEPHEREVDRVRAAILAISANDLARLRHNVVQAKTDYRNLLWWADHPPGATGSTQPVPSSSTGM